MTDIPVSRARRSGAAIRSVAAGERLVLAVFAFLVVVAFVLLYRKGLGTTFYYDEWNFVMNRREWDVETFLRAHNEHLSLLPVLIFKLLFVTVGLDSYGVYRALLLLLHVVCVVLVYVLARERVEPPLALGVAAVILFLGAAWNDLLVPFQISFLLSVAAGLGMLIALERRDVRGHHHSRRSARRVPCELERGDRFRRRGGRPRTRSGRPAASIMGRRRPGAALPLLAHGLRRSDSDLGRPHANHARKGQPPISAGVCRDSSSRSLGRHHRAGGGLGPPAGPRLIRRARSVHRADARDDAPASCAVGRGSRVLGPGRCVPRARESADGQPVPVPRRDPRSPHRARALTAGRDHSASSPRGRRPGRCIRDRQLRLTPKRVTVSPGLVAVRPGRARRPGGRGRRDEERLRSRSSPGAGHHGWQVFRVRFATTARLRARRQRSRALARPSGRRPTPSCSKRLARP